MTAVDDITSLRQRREEIVNQHAEAENRHDVEATIASFHHPRYEFNGAPSDGAEAVRELLQGLMHGLPDLHIDLVKLRHADDAVIIEGLSTGTQDGEWAGIPPTGAASRFRLPQFSSSTRTDSYARRSIWTLRLC
jgi:predicted ester cyclase